MIEALTGLSPHLRSRLESALDSGLLTLDCSVAALQSVLSISGGVDEILAGLRELEGTGITGKAAAQWLRALGRASVGTPMPDLVWSGPELPGLHARDTRRVFEELVGVAESSLWVCTFAYFDGPRVFRDLAQRLDGMPGLQVKILLNIQRVRGDTTAADQLVRRFTDRFWGSDWPGAVRPSVYYDPRSLDLDDPGSVLHAKAVVADGEAVFITSANMTDAALDRNIELGLLVRDRALAANVTAHFQGLIDLGLLNSLPSS